MKTQSAGQIQYTPITNPANPTPKMLPTTKATQFRTGDRPRRTYTNTGKTAAANTGPMAIANVTPRISASNRAVIEPSFAPGIAMKITKTKKLNTHATGINTNPQIIVAICNTDTPAKIPLHRTPSEPITTFSSPAYVMDLLSHNHRQLYKKAQETDHTSSPSSAENHNAK